MGVDRFNDFTFHRDERFPINARSFFKPNAYLDELTLKGGSNLIGRKRMLKWSMEISCKFLIKLVKRHVR